MIGMAAENRQTAIDLLAQHDAYQKMRPDLSSESKALSRSEGIRGKAVRAPNHKHKITIGSVAEPGELFGKALACHVAAARIKHNDMGPRRDLARQSLGFLNPAGPSLAQLGYRHFLEHNLGDARLTTKRTRPPDEVITKRRLGRTTPMAYRGNRQAHGLMRRAFRLGHPPHALKIIVLAHLWAEQMHNDIASIDQNPIALRQTIGGPRTISRFLEAPDQMFGSGSDMTRRATACNHQRIGQRRAPSKIDDHNILRLVVFQ